MAGTLAQGIVSRKSSHKKVSVSFPLKYCPILRTLLKRWNLYLLEDLEMFLYGALGEY